MKKRNPQTLQDAMPGNRRMTVRRAEVRSVGDGICSVRPVGSSTIVPNCTLVGTAKKGDMVVLQTQGNERTVQSGGNSVAGATKGVTNVVSQTVNQITGSSTFSGLTGTIADIQAPQFLKVDGSRALTGNMGVSNLVTIDGIDLSEDVVKKPLMYY